MLLIDRLFQSLNADQVLEKWLSNLQALGIPARSWRPAGAYRTILRVVAISYASFSQVMADFIASNYLDSATETGLKLLAKNVFQVTVPDATFATGQVQLTNGGGGVFPFDPGEIVFKNSTTGKTYVVDESGTLNPGDVLLVAVRAQEAGSASTSTPGTIDALVTQLTDVTVTNLASVIGVDSPSDDQIRALCRAKLSSLSVRGPRGAYEYAVLSAKLLDGSTVNINRVQVSPFSSNGTVNVWAAAPSGTPTPEDLAAAADNIEAFARPDTAKVFFNGSVQVPVTRTLTIWCKNRPGLKAADVQAKALQLLDDELRIYPLGGIPKPPSDTGYLWASFLEGVCKAADAGVFAVDGAGPDLLLAPGQVAVLAATVDVRLVSQ